LQVTAPLQFARSRIQTREAKDDFNKLISNYFLKRGVRAKLVLKFGLI